MHHYSPLLGASQQAQLRVQAVPCRPAAGSWHSVSGTNILLAVQSPPLAVIMCVAVITELPGGRVYLAAP